jgi:ABC-type phosphonate transport system ATPase subunit
MSEYNPCIEAAHFRQGGVHEWQGEEGSTDATNLAAIIDAQVEATLALAYEQRTANLIALYSMDDSARQGMIDGAGMHSGNWVDVTRQIKERLGL